MGFSAGSLQNTDAYYSMQTKTSLSSICPAQNKQKNPYFATVASFIIIPPKYTIVFLVNIQ